MIFWWILIIVGIALLIFLSKLLKSSDSPNSLKNFPSQYYKTKVKWVKDGDSVQILNGNKEHEVRLYGIDCPEHGQEWGEIAKAGLIKLIGNRDIYLEILGMDCYDRVLGMVYVEDGTELINVNEKMIVKGHAWVMRKYYKKLSKSQRKQFDRLERWARNKRVGLWANNNPCPPWEWRKIQ